MAAAAASSSSLKERLGRGGIASKADLGRGRERVAHVGTRDCGVGTSSVSPAPGAGGVPVLNRSLINHPPSAPPVGISNQDRHAKGEAVKARRAGEGAATVQQQRGAEGLSKHDKIASRIGEKTPSLAPSEGARPRSLSPLAPSSGDDHIAGDTRAMLRTSRLQAHDTLRSGRDAPMGRFDASLKYEGLLGDLPPSLTPPPPELGYDRRFYGPRQGSEQYHREGRSDPNFSSLGFLSPIYPNSGAGGSGDERPRGAGTGCAMNGNMSSEEYSAMRSGGGGDVSRRGGPRAGGSSLPPPMARPSSLLPPGGGNGGPMLGNGEGDLGAEGYPFDDQSNLGFLVVTQLVKTGAADQAGLHVGDIFIKFGSITKSNFPGLKSLAEVVRHSASMGGIPAVVLRRMEACVNDNGQPLVFDSPVLQKIHLTLRPLHSQDVGGGGVLGAVINTWPLPEPVKYH